VFPSTGSKSTPSKQTSRSRKQAVRAAGKKTWFRYSLHKTLASLYLLLFDFLLGFFFDPMMETVSSSERSVNFYRTT
jgi:hypothetical protein